MYYGCLVEIDDETQSANLIITGGIGYVPITFDGLDSYDGWELIRLDESGNEELVDQSIQGNDFWQTDYNPTTGKWSRTYNVLLDTPGDQARSVEFIFRRNCI